ncbi:hypothetical protein GN244_ATG07377 [Phytophthora infestans]|uniref:Uncharacterized protein n=1 Tax=Phytophthora infestans TaxID=4787 RepID=A0A833WFL4_PHYIN|nr:hypothetical protein GN244_ATG07377 [Phytophthora infestans]KAF4147878.1 hypothetical protein GN958_ATG02944 [Phytophthora infestans]
MPSIATISSAPEPERLATIVPIEPDPTGSTPSNVAADGLGSGREGRGAWGELEVAADATGPPRTTESLSDAATRGYGACRALVVLL